jgi:hypothetical protein
MDSVNHPSHYTFSSIETIEVIEQLTDSQQHLGTAVKYLSRAGKKSVQKEKEDLDKAIWYLRRYIKQFGLTIRNRYHMADPNLTERVLKEWGLTPERTMALRCIFEAQSHAVGRRKQLLENAILYIEKSIALL